MVQPVPVEPALDIKQGAAQDVSLSVLNSFPLFVPTQTPSPSPPPRFPSPVCCEEDNEDSHLDPGVQTGPEEAAECLQKVFGLIRAEMIPDCF